jgi:PAP2 superfamily
VSGGVVAKPQDTVVRPTSTRTPDHDGTTPEPQRESRRATLRAFFAELLLIALLITVYQGVRHLAIGHFGEAADHAEWVWRLERALYLPNEATMQRWVLGWPDAARLANLYYVGVHFPGTTVALVWLFLRHRAVYLRTRTELVLLTSAGLVVHVLFPLAPPRLVHDLGMVDTMLAVGPSAYSSPNTGFANQYAAMPSLHIGWAILVAVAVLRASRSRWRWLIVLHPVLTTTVVVVTANHYWLDGIVAALLLAVSVLLVRWLFGPRLRRAAARKVDAEAQAVASLLN